MVDGKVGVLQHPGADRQIDNEVNDLGDGSVYRQRVVAFGPDGGPIPAGTQDAEPQPLFVATGVLTLVGDATVFTPGAGLKALVKWTYCVDQRTATAPIITVRFGANAPFYTAYAISKKQRFTGAVDEPVVINLDSAGAVAYTLFCEEVA